MANLLLTPDDIFDYDDNSPPAYYVDGVMVFNATGFFLGYWDSPALPDSSLAASGTISHDGADSVWLLVRNSDTGVNLYAFELIPGFENSIYFNVPLAQGSNYAFGIYTAVDGVTVAEVTNLVLELTPTTGVSPVNLNCDCTSDIEYRTLAEMRQDMLIGLGRGNQLANPGPGVAALVDMHLRKAQERIYSRAQWMLMERYFTWPLVAGTKFYGIKGNADECQKKLDPHKITSVSIIRDGVFWPLIAGIPATLETYTEIAGPPQRYEVRGCIEVWPTPTVDGDTLVVKGNFGVQPLVEDNDRACIDDELVCDLALATLKRHFRQPDANDYVQMAEVKLRNLIGGSHTTRRYIPGRKMGDDLVWVEPRPSVPFPS